jgi:hypothetical protein
MSVDPLRCLTNQRRKISARSTNEIATIGKTVGQTDN